MGALLVEYRGYGGSAGGTPTEEGLYLVLPDRYDTLAKAEGIHTPTLIVHGDRDEVVPFDMGRRWGARSRARASCGCPGPCTATCI